MHYILEKSTASRKKSQITLGNHSEISLRVKISRETAVTRCTTNAFNTKLGDFFFKTCFIYIGRLKIPSHSALDIHYIFQ